VAGTWPVPPKRDRRGEGAQYERKCITGKPRPMGGELHLSVMFKDWQERRRLAMTKVDIVEGIYEKVGFSKKEVAKIVEYIFDIIKDTLIKEDKIKVSGFGNFVVRKKRPRRGRNPQTGTDIEITARRILTFKPSQVLKGGLNRKEL
jgi:integration host factor subunit alpha